MRSAALRWLVLAFTCAWFGVLAPVHQRGVVQLPGSSPAKDCCTTKPKHGDTAPVRNTGNCAVCHLIATLDLPSTTDLSVGVLQLVEIARTPTPQPAFVAPRHPPFYSHAPPISA